MPEPISFGKLDFNLVSSMTDTRGVPKPETPFHMLVMGDFSGRESRIQNRSGSALTDLRPLPADRDNLDSLVAKLGVKIHLPILGGNALHHYRKLGGYGLRRVCGQRGIHL